MLASGCFVAWVEDESVQAGDLGTETSQQSFRGDAGASLENRELPTKFELFRRTFPYAQSV